MCTGKLWFISVCALFPYGVSVWCFCMVFLYSVSVRCTILYGGWLSMFLVHGVVRVCIFILQELITQPSRYLRLIRAVQDANLRLYVFLGDRESGFI